MTDIEIVGPETMLLCKDQFGHEWTQTWGEMENILARTRRGQRQMIRIVISLGLSGEATATDRMHKRVHITIITKQ